MLCQLSRELEFDQRPLLAQVLVTQQFLYQWSEDVEGVCTPLVWVVGSFLLLD